jgi:hypothetical protein
MYLFLLSLDPARLIGAPAAEQLLLLPSHTDELEQRCYCCWEAKVSDGYCCCQKEPRAQQLHKHLLTQLVLALLLLSNLQVLGLAYETCAASRLCKLPSRLQTATTSAPHTPLMHGLQIHHMSTQQPKAPPLQSLMPHIAFVSLLDSARVVLLHAANGMSMQQTVHCATG